MTAGDDWRDDASLPSAPSLGSVTRAAVVVGAVAAVAAASVVLWRSVNDVTSSACRLREASEGVSGLERAGVAVGEPLPPGWRAPPAVKVRYQRADVAAGTVVDATTCLSGDPDRLTVVVAGPR